MYVYSVDRTKKIIRAKYGSIIHPESLANKKILKLCMANIKNPPTIETFSKKKYNPFGKPDAKDDERILDDIIQKGDTICPKCGKPVSMRRGSSGPTYVKVKLGYMHKNCYKVAKKKYTKLKKAEKIRQILDNV